MTTTLQDYGRTSEKFGEIPYYCAYPIRLWIAEHQVKPEDVETWCRENCTGLYRVVTYTHKDSVRKKYSRTGEFDVKIVYVDKVYLASEDDATLIKLTYQVKDTKIMRPRLAPKRRKRGSTGRKNK